MNPTPDHIAMNSDKVTLPSHLANLFYHYEEALEKDEDLITPSAIPVQMKTEELVKE